MPSSKPGLFYAVHLKDVYAEGVEYLDPNKEAGKPVFGIIKIEKAMAERHRRKGWTK